MLWRSATDLPLMPVVALLLDTCYLGPNMEFAGSSYVGIQKKTFYVPISSEVGSEIPHACESQLPNGALYPASSSSKQADLQVTDLHSYPARTQMQSPVVSFKL